MVAAVRLAAWLCLAALMSGHIAGAFAQGNSFTETATSDDGGQRVSVNTADDGRSVSSSAAARGSGSVSASAVAVSGTHGRQRSTIGFGETNVNDEGVELIVASETPQPPEPAAPVERQPPSTPPPPAPAAGTQQTPEPAAPAERQPQTPPPPPPPAPAGTSDSTTSSASSSGSATATASASVTSTGGVTVAQSSAVSTDSEPSEAQPTDIEPASTASPRPAAPQPEAVPAAVPAAVVIPTSTQAMAAVTALIDAKNNGQDVTQQVATQTDPKPLFARDVKLCSRLEEYHCCSIQDFVVNEHGTFSGCSESFKRGGPGSCRYQMVSDNPRVWKDVGPYPSLQGQLCECANHDPTPCTGIVKAECCDHDGIPDKCRCLFSGSPLERCLWKKVSDAPLIYEDSFLIEGRKCTCPSA